MNAGALASSLAMAAAVLVTRLPNPPVLTRAQIAGRGPERPDAVAAGSPRAEPLTGTVTGPDAGGVVDLAALLSAAQRTIDQAQPVNPFRLRYHPPLPARTVTVTVGALISGPTPDRDCCVLNDQVLRAGESFAGLVIERIGPGAIILGLGAYHLAVPTADRPVILRLPPER